MAYGRTFWLNHVVDPATQQVIQQGTPQDQDRFNNIEEGVFAGDAMALEAIRMARLLKDKTDGLTGEKKTVELTNTQKYPFNNSIQTVSLATSRNTQDYTVYAEIVSYENGGVGSIEITEKLLNGFKIAFTGAASRVVVNCYIQGGI
ncbi:hypothetical protein [Calorimonas adulescens]|uniref:Uncharacterized protein n=1 Tax=Calorimonas adulescens TaxID=2606906 RepID=A0A5D8QI31_9THEO|nr:hypothetical protein [Calorimonas adulescens]TZE83526.1 hypothetical protein FWJ32_01195 [Calorimonas adulescens]